MPRQETWDEFFGWFDDVIAVRQGEWFGMKCSKDDAFNAHMSHAPSSNTIAVRAHVAWLELMTRYEKPGRAPRTHAQVETFSRLAIAFATAFGRLYERNHVAWLKRIEEESLSLAVSTLASVR